MIYILYICFIKPVIFICQFNYNFVWHIIKLVFIKESIATHASENDTKAQKQYFVVLMYASFFFFFYRISINRFSCFLYKIILIPSFQHLYFCFNAVFLGGEECVFGLEFTIAGELPIHSVRF